MINFYNFFVLLVFPEFEYSGKMELIDKSESRNHGAIYTIEFKVKSDVFSHKEVSLLASGVSKDEYDSNFIGDIIPLAFYSKGNVFYAKKKIKGGIRDSLYKEKPK